MGVKLILMIFSVAMLPVRSWADLLPDSEVQIYGGIFSFDLMGVGNENFIGLAYSKPINGTLAIKGSTSYVRTLQQYGVRIPYLIPEVGVEVGKQVGFAKPFVGAGAGVILDLRTDMPDSASYVVLSGSGTQIDKSVETVGLDENPLDASFYAEVGVKFKLPNQVSALVVSTRIRAHEIDFSGVSTEVGVGMATSF